MPIVDDAEMLATLKRVRASEPVVISGDPGPLLTRAIALDLVEDRSPGWEEAEHYYLTRAGRAAAGLPAKLTVRDRWTDLISSLTARA